MCDCFMCYVCLCYTAECDYNEFAVRTNVENTPHIYTAILGSEEFDAMMAYLLLN